MKLQLKISKGWDLEANWSEANFKLTLNEQQIVYLFGEVFYWIQEDGTVQFLNQESEATLRELFQKETLSALIPRLEGQYIGLWVDKGERRLHLFSDRYARWDTFYVQDSGHFYFATDLDFIFQHVRPRIDPKMLLHFFAVYGWYTPKGKTLYQDVYQLKVGEILTISDQGVVSKTIPFQPLAIQNYQTKDLEVYYRLLTDSIAARVQANGAKEIWVSSSSGWDSSALLGLLVDQLGSQNVRMMTGSMVYSKQTEVINKFEIEKIKKIGAFFGIQPEIVPFDFQSNRALAFWKKVMPFFRGRQIYSYANYNFARIAAALSACTSPQTIFNGETSDSFHNFGFSQFVTFFHTCKSFSEYGDKMNCYLYGPSFFRKVLEGNYERDNVYRIFKKMYANVSFSSNLLRREEIIEAFLFPFIYGGPRLPFAQTEKNPLFSEEGQHVLYTYPFREYIPEVLSSLNEENVYSWLIYLYHNFHSQGSTVNVHKQAMATRGHAWRMPFNDYRLVSFLSQAPEQWGRGLELNHTKYPLKWVLQNKIRFPYDLLEVGPHSYLYDVIEGFSLGREISCHSGLTPYFKETLAAPACLEIFSDEYFDLRYLNRIREDFLQGREAGGQDLNNLISWITLATIGWYS